MKKAPLNFKKNGYTYEQLKRSSNTILYAQKQKSKVYTYEVHKVRLNPLRDTKFEDSKGNVRVVSYPETERLAGNEDFGKYGWTYVHFKNAINKYEELKQGEKE